jgi:competence protein ComFA
MRVSLYAVRLNGKWRPRLSVHLGADIRFWTGREDAGPLIVIRPELPVAYAVSIAARIEQHGGKTGSETAWLELVRQAAGLAGWDEPLSVRTVLTGRLRTASGGVPLDGTGGVIGEQAPEWGTRQIETVNRIAQLLRGRLLLPGEFTDLLAFAGLQHALDHWRTYLQWVYLCGGAEFAGGMDVRRRRKRFGRLGELEYRCVRCGSAADKHYRAECPDCGGRCRYCGECLTMGRCKPCTLVIRGRPAGIAEPGADSSAAAGFPAPPRSGSGRGCLSAQANGLRPEEWLEPWGLSPAQRAASEAGIRFLLQSSSDETGAAARRRAWTGGSAAAGGSRGSRADLRSAAGFLIWAVTGAGKTEMIFPLIACALALGRRVAVATPRRDVVLELEPRLRRAFPQHTLIALYGGSGERWRTGEITLATTHQLLRFAAAFDVVIIDELDAFPFHNSDSLQFAARRACKPQGRYIFLSATPPRRLQRDARRGKLPHVKVPVRFHRHPLPVPKLVRLPPLDRLFARGRLPRAILGPIGSSLARGAQLFVFVPVIRQVEPLTQLLRGHFPGLRIEGTSSKDGERTDKVRQFRAGDIRVLVTTTILERGVTVPKTDVFITDAHSSLFDDAALVQMSGRAGRSKEDPAGRVYFFSEHRTISQLRAIRQIKEMNRLASRKGYLISLEQEGR